MANSVKMFNILPLLTLLSPLFNSKGKCGRVHMLLNYVYRGVAE
jgi:hypothetical protein